MCQKIKMQLVCILLIFTCGVNAQQHPPYSWQQQYAKVLPQGEIHWQPVAFKPEMGREIRYIDFENGDDLQDGLTKSTAWRHHPWDPVAIGYAKLDVKGDTYLFKRGVTYRGCLKVNRSGTAQYPIRLTSDPQWGGDAQAICMGSEKATGWQKLAKASVSGTTTTGITTDFGDWAKVTCPEYVNPDETFTITLELNRTFEGEKVVLGLNWSRKNREFAGYNTGSNPGNIDAKIGKYTFKITPKNKADLGGYSLAVYRSTSGSWADRTAVETLGLKLMSEKKTDAIAPEILIPDGDHVWYVDLEYTPRNIWLIDQDDQIKRIPLARMPNWQVTNEDDVKSQWWEFDNPFNPHFQRVKVGNSEYHLAADTKHLTMDADYYKGAYIWSEYGWVMGTPYPSRIEHFFPDKKGVAIRGQFGGPGGYVIPRYSRYYLEDKPQFLDDPNGEFWFKKVGSGGRLFIRLPDDQNPNEVDIEAGRYSTLIDIENGVEHLSISGLSFRFTNTFWDLDASPFASKDVDPACIRLVGYGKFFEIKNNQFEHVNMPVLLAAKGDQAVVDHVLISDNVVNHTDHGAFNIKEVSNWREPYPKARLLNVRILRNKLDYIGMRPTYWGQGHAIEVAFAQICEVAGNVLDHLYGAGIFVFGGKQSSAKLDRPFSRVLIHHNVVTNSMLNTNDWGGIETWQGGSAYVYDNISGNPGGFKLWGIKNQPQSPASARFGHAFYMDGGFKQYYFNNIAWGKSSDPYSPLGNTAAFQEIHGFLASIFNNTAYNFVIGSRRQAPEAGKNKYMGNIFSHIGDMVFRHAQPSKHQADPNAKDVGTVGSDFDHTTNVYTNNLFYKIPNNMGAFESNGDWYGSFYDMQKAMADRGTIGNLGQLSKQPVLRDPINHDFTPTSEARDMGVKVFVPWELYATSAEWHFYHKGDDPTKVPDEHFHMEPSYVERTDYHNQPRFDLTLVNGKESDYLMGALEDWTKGAVIFDGNQKYATINNQELQDLVSPKVQKVQNKPSDWVSIDAPDALVPDEKATIKFNIKKPVVGMLLRVDLHWSDTNHQYKGVNTYGGKGIPVNGIGQYEISLTPKDMHNLGSYTVTAWLTPTGDWNDRTEMYQYQINKGRSGAAQIIRSPEIYTSNFIIEAYFRAEKQNEKAILIQKHDGKIGYAVTLDQDGHMMFETAGDNKKAMVSSRKEVSDNQWHHILAECDRTKKTLKLFIDGKLDAQATGFGAVSLENKADVFVGGSNQGQFLNGAIDFLRISHGTLTDAQTSIEELYAWQFDGPFLHDFTGYRPVGKRDAGAIDSREL